LRAELRRIDFLQLGLALPEYIRDRDAHADP
jgi:hypothetical protein